MGWTLFYKEKAAELHDTFRNNRKANSLNADMHDAYRTERIRVAATWTPLMLSKQAKSKQESEKQSLVLQPGDHYDFNYDD